MLEEADDGKKQEMTGDQNEHDKKKFGDKFDDFVRNHSSVPLI